MIIAYASGAANPTQSQVDFTVDLQGGDTLPTTAQLYGGGSDSSDPSAAFTFSWSIVHRPSTSNAALDDVALQNPTLGAVDVWGNYLLFLIVTNSATGQTSETDPLAAPQSAFVTVRVQSEELGLEKPAAGERDWYTIAHQWVDTIEDHEGRLDTLEADTTDLNELTDVTLGTLTSGEALLYNGAQWVNGAVASQLDALTDVTLGTLASGQVLNYDGAVWSNGTPATLTVDAMNVNGDLTVNADSGAADPTIFMLDETANTPALTYDRSAQEFKIKRTNAEGFKSIITEADRASTSEYGVARVETNTTGYNTTGKILDVERLMFTGVVDGMVDYKNATQHHKTTDGDVEIEANDATNIAQRAALVFRNVTGEEIAISDISIVMASSGISTTVDYAFSLVIYNTLNGLASNSTSSVYALPTFTRIGDNKAGACEFNYVTHNSGAPYSIPADAYFGILVTSEPDSYAGNRLQCTMQAFRLIS